MKITINGKTRKARKVPTGYGKRVVVPYNWGHITKKGKVVGRYQMIVGK